MSKLKARKAEGNRLVFWCPGCKHGHGIIYGTKDGWTWNGDLENPTISPSVLVYDDSGTLCHSFVTNGRIQFLDDCKHQLANKTVELPEWPYS